MTFNKGLKQLPPAGAVYAIGNFDGVHHGHRRLFSICRDIAQKDGRAVCAVTFDGLNKEGGRLFTSSDREMYLREAGADYIICENFDSIRNMAPEEFTDKYLVENLSPSAVVCGGDFRFGRMGSGDTGMLCRLLARAKVPVIVADTVFEEGAPVSTSRIKDALSKGDVELAERLLGRSYSFEYPVEEGKKLGRTIGAPTINQRFPEGMFIPKFGVYAGVAELCDRLFACVTNIGRRPTVDDGDGVTAESYIMGYDGDLYGRYVRVGLTKYIRPEIKFASVEALSEQIARDASEAALVFERNGGI